jgi:hypothetical protein
MCSHTPRSCASGRSERPLGSLTQLSGTSLNWWAAALSERAARCCHSRLAGRISTPRIHRCRLSAPRTRPHHSWRSFTHQSSWPALDHVAVSTEILNVAERSFPSIVSTAGPVKIVVQSGRVVRTTWPLMPSSVTSNAQSWRMRFSTSIPSMGLSATSAISWAKE